MRKIRLWVGLVLATMILPVAAQSETAFSPVELLVPDVIATYPHDPEAFTQGLLVGGDNLLYESTGRYGQSTLRSVELDTGEVLRRYALPDEVFAEGLALFNERLYQITWQAQVAVVYELETGVDEDTFEPLGVYQYGGEGWGLCADDEFLYMSDGSHTITVRDPETFAPVRQYTVTLYGAFVDQLNELECVGDDIYANVWQSDTVLRFAKDSGVVNAVIDGAGLLEADVRAGLEGGAVLNGIAYDANKDVFYMTGKLWPSLFEVEFVPADN